MRNTLEIRTEDNRLLCMAQLIEGDILLIIKSAGREIQIPYTEIPRLVAAAKVKKHGHRTR